MHLYAIALGSNRRHAGMGEPRRIVRAAFARLDDDKTKLVAASRIFPSRPIGPSRRRYANAAGVIETALSPSEFLLHLKSIEAEFGVRRGQRWASRVLDLDIILWSGGSYADDRLTIPHIAFRDRDFVLQPLCHIAPDWVDPVTNRTVRQILAHLRKPRNCMSDEAPI